MIYSLQSVRFVLALLIFHHHFFVSPQIEQFGTFPVSFFFILSGFLLSVGYAEKVSNESFQYRKFVLKRFSHVYSLNIVGLILYLLYPLVIGIYSGEFKAIDYTLLLDVFLLQSWFPVPSVFFSGNAVCWFLSDIVFCYLMFPFLVKMRNSIFHYLYTCFFIACYFIIVCLLPTESVYYFLYINPLFRVIDFLLGIELYYMYKRLLSYQFNKQSFFVNSILELFVVIFCAVSLLIFKYVPYRFSCASFYWVPTLLFILVFSYNKDNGGLFTRLFNARFFNYLGGVSFPFYVFHLIVITWFKSAISILGLNISHYMGFVICVIISIILSCIYMQIVEPVMSNKLKKLYS